MGRRHKKRRKDRSGAASPQEKSRAKDTSPPPSAADRYVAELAAEGKAAEAGTFTLDREVAEKKLREFQLPDQDFYILLLVQAAVRQGAERIDITATERRIRLEYSAPPLEMEDLEQLYDAALGGGDPTDPLRQSLRRALGLGISVARGRSRHLQLISRAGAEGVRLVVQPNAPDTYDSFRGAAAGMPTQTTIAIELGPEWDPDEHEIPMLRERCRYATTNIVLNGRPISHGLTLPEAAAKVPIHRGSARGEAGFEPLSKGPPELRIVRDGVLIAQREIPMDDPRFVAVVQDEALLTDLSGFDVVRDKKYEHLLQIVGRAEHRAQREHRVDQVCNRWVDLEAEDILDSLKQRHHKLRRRLLPALLGLGLLLVAGLAFGAVLMRRADFELIQVLFSLLLIACLVYAIRSEIPVRLRRWFLIPRLKEHCLALVPPEPLLWESVQKQAGELPDTDIKKALTMAHRQLTPG